jgi:hypothetical protein
MLAAQSPVDKAKVGWIQGHSANTRVFSPSDDDEHIIETVMMHTDGGTAHTRVEL